MTKFSSLLSVALVGVLLSGCTLTPSRFDGEDLLDTEHKTEHQDPVAVPVKEYSDQAVVKSSIKPAEKKIAKAEPKKLITETAPVKTEEKKVEEKKPEAKIETKPVTPPAPPAVAPVVTPVTPPAQKHEKCVAKETKKTDMPKREILQKGDRVKVTVFREKDLTNEYQLNDKGDITFPLLGKVAAEGLNAAQLQEKLKEALSKGYLVKPEVTVEFSPDCNH